MYFIVINGSQAGPFTKEQLRFQNITPSTLVWREGMSDWAAASTFPELSDLFVEESAFGAYAQHQPETPVQPQGQTQYPPYNGAAGQPYGNPYNNPYNDPYRREPSFPENYTNWQTWAIIGTVCGALFSCIGLIFGIMGIVNANKANKFYLAGMRELGDAANSTARTMTIISLCLAALGIGIGIFKGKELIDQLSLLY